VDFNKNLSEDLNVSGSVGFNVRQDKYQQDGIESTNQLVFGFINHANFVNHSATNGFTGGQFQFLKKNMASRICRDAC